MGHRLGVHTCCFCFSGHVTSLSDPKKYNKPCITPIQTEWYVLARMPLNPIQKVADRFAGRLSCLQIEQPCQPTSKVGLVGGRYTTQGLGRCAPGKCRTTLKGVTRNCPSVERGRSAVAW